MPPAHSRSGCATRGLGFGRIEIMHGSNAPRTAATVVRPSGAIHSQPNNGCPSLVSRDLSAGRPGSFGFRFVAAECGQGRHERRIGRLGGRTGSRGASSGGQDVCCPFRPVVPCGRGGVSARRRRVGDVVVPPRTRAAERPVPPVVRRRPSSATPRVKARESRVARPQDGPPANRGIVLRLTFTNRASNGQNAGRNTNVREVERSVACR